MEKKGGGKRLLLKFERKWDIRDLNSHAISRPLVLTGEEGKKVFAETGGAKENPGDKSELAEKSITQSFFLQKLKKPRRQNDSQRTVYRG
jgi:hypothetical protein